MKQAVMLFLLSVVWISAFTQQPASPADAQLLDRLAGNWVLQGAIGGRQVTHDVQADWVLNHEYLRLHELSREKKPGGAPAYEAIIFIEWNPKAREFVCLWLDSTSGGGLNPKGLAHGRPTATSIPFIFDISPTEFLRNTFIYNPAAGAWQWLIDDVTNGKPDRFADVKLTRRP